jgi:hypothetical protein
MSVPDPFALLGRMEGDFRPDPARPRTILRQDILDLPDGEYVLTVVDATVKVAVVKTVQTTLLVVGLRIEDAVVEGKQVKAYAGLERERTWYLSSVKALQILAGDLVRLGLDADQWTTANGRPFSSELRRHLPALSGTRFSGSIVRKPNAQGVTYPALYISGAIKPGHKGEAAPAAPDPSRNGKAGGERQPAVATPGVAGAPDGGDETC